MKFSKNPKCISIQCFSFYLFYCFSMVLYYCQNTKCYIIVKKYRNFIWIVYIPHRLRGVATLIKDIRFVMSTFLGYCCYSIKCGRCDGFISRLLLLLNTTRSAITLSHLLESQNQASARCFQLGWVPDFGCFYNSCFLSFDGMYATPLRQSGIYITQIRFFYPNKISILHIYYPNKFFTQIKYLYHIYTTQRKFLYSIILTLV